MNTDFERQIENLSKKGNTIKDKLLNKDFFLRSTEFGVSTVEKEEIVFNSKKSNFVNYLLSGFVAIFVAFKFKEPVVTYSVICIIIVVLIIGYSFSLIKKSKIIKMNYLSVEIENSKFEWNDIYDFGVLVKPSRYITYYELLIFSNSKGKKVFNLYSFQKDKDNIIKI